MQINGPVPNEVDENRKRLCIVLDIFLFSLTIYLLTASGVDGSDVGGARIHVLSSITNSFDLNVPVGLGNKGIDGRDYSLFGLGSVLLTLPLYFCGKVAATDPAILVNCVHPIVGAAINVLVFLFSHSLGNSKRTSATIAFIYGFASTAWYYSKDPGDHNIETFFVLLAVYFMHRHTITDKTSHLFCSAFSIGFCILTRPNTLVAIPALLLLLAYGHYQKQTLKIEFTLFAKKLCFFAIGLVPFVSLFMWYNFYRFGSVFETGYHIMSVQMKLNFFTGTDFVTGLSGLILSPGKGFFYYSPAALLFFISIRSFFKTNTKLAVCFITLIFSYFIFYAKNIYWHGDWAWGPRYVLATLPYFIIPVASLLDKPSRWIRLTIIAVCTLGITVQILAISINPMRYFIHLQRYENVKFTVASGTGVQPIVEPPPKTHFDWQKAPLLYQLKFISESYKYISNYKQHGGVVRNSDQTISAEPIMKLYDFWWFYQYFIDKSYNSFGFAALLLFLAIRCGRKLYIHAFKSDFTRSD